EYELAQAQLAQDRQPDYLSFEFANVHDTVTLAQMSPLETGARWLEARDERYLMRIALEQSPGCPPTVPMTQALDSLRRASTGRSAQVLGTITAGDTAYVVFRHPRVLGDGEFDMETRARPSVLTLSRHNASWVIHPDEQSLRRSQGMMVSGCVSYQVPPDSLPQKKKPPL
ncbi:MAG TPA: hypothetical protein VFT29_12105, partial [Gemmatimonadaceae bacterium]|nr:hypothetical protein [Gemmatimonadaceae bacterium]